jgi:hypothetical protein
MVVPLTSDEWLGLVEGAGLRETVPQPDAAGAGYRRIEGKG